MLLLLVELVVLVTVKLQVDGVTASVGVYICGDEDGTTIEAISLEIVHWKSRECTTEGGSQEQRMVVHIVTMCFENHSFTHVGNEWFFLVGPWTSSFPEVQLEVVPLTFNMSAYIFLVFYCLGLSFISHPRM